MDLFLIRHGKINRDGTTSDYFYTLSSDGIKEVKAMACFLKENYHNENGKSLILSSNTLRTIETSIILSSAIKEKIEIVNAAHEMDMGYNDCKDKSLWKYVTNKGEFTDRKGFSNLEKFVTRHYLGESPYDVFKRLELLKNKILEFDGSSLYVVGHGTTLRILLMKIDDKCVDWYYDEPIPDYSSVRKLVLDKNKVISNKYIWR